MPTYNSQNLFITVPLMGPRDYLRVVSRSWGLFLLARKKCLTNCFLSMLVKNGLL